MSIAPKRAALIGDRETTAEKKFIISAMTHKFCDQCNRVRMTAEGFLKACLQYQTGTDLKNLMRSGCTDDELTEAIQKVIWEKPVSHHFTSEEIETDECKLMSQIGG